MIAYKFLRPDGTGAFTGFSWPLLNGGPSAWVEAREDPCRSGIHACRRSTSALGRPRLYEAELDGEILEHRSKLIASRARLTRRIEAWEADARALHPHVRRPRARRTTTSTASPLAQWEAVIEPSIPEGPALLGFVAARIAEEASGTRGLPRRRARQTDWLVKQLGLKR